MKKRIIFTFDARSLESLMELKRIGRFRSLGETVKAALQIRYTIAQQAALGFTELAVRNSTGQERIICV